MSYDPEATEHSWDIDLDHLDALAEDAALAEYHELVVAAVGTDPKGPAWTACATAEDALLTWVPRENVLAACRTALIEAYGAE